MVKSVQVIVPHAGTDFDALGSAVGAQALYPQAELVLPGSLMPGVQEFVSLHRYQLRARTAREIDLDAVNLLVVVDTLEPDRLGPLAGPARRAGTRLHLYDHHPRESGDLAGELEIWAEVGACSTLVAELLAEAGQTLQPFQATALLLGIYADTGSLTLPSTTPRDALAVGWLLEQGGSLRVVDRFLETELTPPQQELLEQLGAAGRVWTGRGAHVRIAPGYTAGYVGGLAHVVHKLQALQPAPAIFVAVQMGDRVHLVGRSEVAWVDVARVLAHFGGGGHPGAAAAVARGAALPQVLALLEQALAAEVGRPVTARDLMKSPVRAVRPDTTIAEAERVMLRYGHSGMVVVQDGRVVGVISRRDAEHARRHGLGHAPVKGAMGHPAITVAPDTTLDELQSLLSSRDIGRLPVVENGRLVGIVTRNDVLTQLYGAALPHWHRTLYTGEPPDAAAAHGELLYRASALPAAALDVLRAAGRVARQTAVPAYVVGGFVRDLLLGTPNLDIDVVVVGDGIQFARELAQELGGEVQTVQRFGTAHVRLRSGQTVDVASARREFYEYAAALPRVEHGDLREDMYRRDFTINAMAVRLTPAGAGDLVDFFGGYADLKSGRIRVLHSWSFVEDPTRILRGQRFACRYGFQMEPETDRLAWEAVAGGFLERVSAERLRNELLLIFAEETAVQALAGLAGIGALERVLPEVPWSAELADLLAAAREFLQGRDLSPGARALRAQVEPGLLFATVLGSAAQLEQAAAVAERFRLPRGQRQAMLLALGGWQEALRAVTAPGATPSAVDGALADLPPVGLALVWLRGRETLAPARVQAYWTQYRKIRPRVTAADLHRAGLDPGPAYSRALAAARRARLDGRARSRTEELAYALAAVEQAQTGPGEEE